MPPRLLYWARRAASGGGSLKSLTLRLACASASSYSAREASRDEEPAVCARSAREARTRSSYDGAGGPLEERPLTPGSQPPAWLRFCHAMWRCRPFAHNSSSARAGSRKESGLAMLRIGTVKQRGLSASMTTCNSSFTASTSVSFFLTRR